MNVEKSLWICSYKCRLWSASVDFALKPCNETLFETVFDVKELALVKTNKHTDAMKLHEKWQWNNNTNKSQIKFMTIGTRDNSFKYKSCKVSCWCRRRCASFVTSCKMPLRKCQTFPLSPHQTGSPRVNNPRHKLLDYVNTECLPFAICLKIRIVYLTLSS